MFCGIGKRISKASKVLRGHMVMLRGVHSGLPGVMGILLYALLLVLGAVSASAGGPFSVKNSLRGEGLRIIDAASPQFMAEVRKFMDADVVAKSSSFLPYSVVVINDTRRYIWGFTVVYTFPDKIAPVGTPWRHIISPSSGIADRRQMLEPGASMLVTPISSILGSLDARGSQKLRIEWYDGIDRVLRAWDEWTNGRVEAVIDSVIYEDGTLVGPDGAGRMRELNARIRADADLIASLSDLRGAELGTALSLVRSGGPSADEYSRQMAATSQHLLRVLERGDDGFAEAVRQYKATMWFGGFSLIRKVER